MLRVSTTENKLVDVYQLDAANGAMLLLSTQFDLQPLDVVYVTSAPVSRWNRLISQLVPTITGIKGIGDARTDF